MGEAASLPPDDPQRIEMHAEVAKLGAWAEAEWLALLEEGERWRLELSRVTVPEGLEDRLLRIPAEAPRGALHRLRALPPVAWVGIAAAALLAIGAWLFLGGSEPRSDPLNTLAILAMNDHLDTHALDVTASDPRDVEAGLRARIPFEIRFPKLGGELRIEGGRRCTLGSHPVCFTTWRKDAARLTLLQIRRADFGLPKDLAPALVTPRGAAAGSRPLDVLIWTEGEVGYALVADDSSALRDVRPEHR